MRRAWLLTMAVAAVAACGAPGPGECGASTGTTFTLVVWRTQFAPYDFDGGAWDPDGGTEWVDGGWDAERTRYDADVRAVASGASYEFGTFDKVTAVREKYQDTLFAGAVAPDPVVDFWRKPSATSDWVKEGGWYTLPQNQPRADGLKLERLTLGEGTVWLSFMDNDTEAWPTVGAWTLDLPIARSLAGCGKLSYVYSPEAMDRGGTRVQAIEVEVTEVP